MDTLWWLDRFGLTPDQVAELPARDVVRIPLIVAEQDRIEAEERRRASRR